MQLLVVEALMLNLSISPSADRLEVLLQLVEQIHMLDTDLVLIGLI